jgi:hypothetical protein
MMGDIADDLIEQGIDNLAKHHAGICDDYCEYCEEERDADAEAGRKP